MARTVEDVLARRLRMLFLDAKAAISAAERVAELMAAELSYTDDWKKTQVTDFTKLATRYLLQPSSKTTEQPKDVPDKVTY
jgi:glycerol-3-phosphate dehydrogenase